MNKKLFLYVPLCMALITSCNNDSDFEESDINPELNHEALLANTLPIESYPLDWENVSEVSTPNGKVRMPWQAASSPNIDDNILHDYQKEDGWELLYNTFAENSSAEHLFFTLYNKYRGIVRTYYYTRADSEISSSYITSSLALRGNVSSPVLNFADQSIIDVEQNSTVTSMIQPYQFERASWYAFEYELAYDENIKNLSFSQLSQQWKIGSVNISTIKLNGTSTGTIKGTIKSDGKDFNSDNNISSNDQSKLAANFSGDESEDEDSNILKDIGKAIKDGILGGIESGISGIAKNLFSGIFGKKTDTPTVQYVKLDINTEIEMNGTIENSHGGGGPNIPFPGYGASPNGIAYDKSPGVFYLTENPEIKKEVHKTWVWDDDLLKYLPYEHRTYKIITNSYEIKWNPALTAIADIENIKTEIIAQKPKDATGDDPWGNDSTIEQIGNQSFFTGSNIYTGGVRYWNMSIVGVRISFKIKPKNGDPEVFIVKTFKSEITETETTQSPVPPRPRG
ncbi:hypothetical protein [Sinomicrobium sp. M5D2P17]